MDINRKIDNPGKSTSIADIDRRAYNSSSSINAANGEANNPYININIIDIDKRIHHHCRGKDIVDINRKANNLNTSINVAKKGVNTLNIGTADTNIDGKANGQAVASNKACTSFFFLCQALFGSLFLIRDFFCLFIYFFFISNDLNKAINSFF